MKVDTARIKRIRQHLGLSQREAAIRAGWKTAQQWASVESGKYANPGVLTFIAIARVLGVSVESLVSERKSARKSHGTVKYVGRNAGK